MLRSGCWYLVHRDKDGLYVTDNVNKYYLFCASVGKSLEASLFAKEHFLSLGAPEDIWVRMDIETELYPRFKKILKKDFDLSTRKNIVDELINDGGLEGKYFMIYLKLNVDEISIVGVTIEETYGTRSFRYISPLYEIDIDLADTNFYHKQANT